MKTINLNKICLAFLLTFGIVSCTSSDDTNNSTNDSEKGVLSNSEMKLTYGTDLLGQYVNITNSPITFTNYSGTTKARSAAFTLSEYKNYKTPDLTNAIKLTGSNSVNIDQAGKIYYIPAGENYSGNINFNQSATIYVLGTWVRGSVNVPSNSKIEVAPSGVIMNSSFMLNNSTAVLDNYGTVNYGQGSLNGKINNYSQLTFTSNINLNSGSEVTNYCKLTFNESTILNANVINNGYTTFNKGFTINGSGNLILNEASLTDILSGTIGIDGKIKNSSNGIARLDIFNAQLGNINATPAFQGKIDINTSLTIPKSKLDNQIILNSQTFIEGTNCVPQRGIPTCNDNTLKYTLVASINSPIVNSTTLSATDVKVKDGLAYVSYHTNDEFYGDTPNGSIRIFDVQNQQTPSLLAQADFDEIEFNGIDINNGNLYAVGGNKAGAKMITTTLNTGLFNTNDLSNFRSFKLPSLGAKNSFVYNDKLWLVSGSTNGGFYKLNNDYSTSEQFYNEGSRAKYVTQNGYYQAFFAVEPSGAYLRIANIDGTNPKEYRYTTLAQKVQNGKNVITMDDKYIYLALSDRGVAKIELANGNLTNRFEPNTYRYNDKKIFSENGLTNGVAIDNCYLYLANGADGIIVLNKNTFNVIGSFKLAESSNFIYANNGLLYVATGRSGLNIIKVN